MGDNNEVIFADKENDVDWDVVLEVKEAGTLGKLQQAAANNDSEQYDSLVSEIDKLSAALCAFKVNKDDAKTDVDNLSFLFEYQGEVGQEAEDDQGIHGNHRGAANYSRRNA